MEFKNWLENSGIESVLSGIEEKYPGVKVQAYETGHKIEFMQIIVPEDMRGGGVGTEIIRMIQDYARSVGKPIVLRPAAERGRKGDLERFYKGLGFVHNRGRDKDFVLSSPLASTMYWRPECEEGSLLERVETPPHMPYSFWREMIAEAERLESKFLTMKEVQKLERELEDDEYIDMRLSRDFPYQIARMMDERGDKKVSERLKDMLDSSELAKRRPDLYWGEYGVVSRVDALGDSLEAATRYTREYSEFFHKKKGYVNYGEIEKADLTPEGREKVLRLKSVYDAVFNYVRLMKRVGRAVRAVVASRNHKMQSFWSGGDETKHIPQTGKVEVLYHATPYLREILREGFKTKEELGNRESLGGDTSGGISFTADLRVAREIAKCLVEVIRIAKGKMTVNDVLRMIGSERKKGDKPWALEDYINKARQRQWKWSNPATKDLSQRAGVPMPGKPYEINDREEAFSLYRRYLSWSDKRYDPLFFGVDLKHFESMDEGNVGVVSAKVDMTKVIGYHQAMEEYRAPLDAILSVHSKRV